MRNFYRGESLQDIVDTLAAQQLDNVVVEANYEQSYDNFYSESHITLRIALFNKPAVSAESVKKDTFGDFDAAMEIIK
jgi:hypothetical protein